MEDLPPMEHQERFLQTILVQVAEQIKTERLEVMAQHSEVVEVPLDNQAAKVEMVELAEAVEQHLDKAQQLQQDQAATDLLLLNGQIKGIVMNYEILDDDGNVINRIVANADFVEMYHPNKYRLIEDNQRFNSELASEIRKNRNLKLKESDWTQLPDSPVNKQAWADYRQALRDIPQQAGFPTEINWPQEPQ